MAEFRGEQSIVIEAPITAVYEYVSDIPRHTEWNHQPIEISKISDGPAGVGSVFRTKEQTPREMAWLLKRLWPVMTVLVGGTGYTEAEITALEPDHLVAWKAEAPTKKGGFLAKSEWEMRMESQGENTQVTQSFHYEFFGKMAEKMDTEKSAQQTGVETATNLADLKAIMETEPVQETALNQVSLA